MISYTYTERRIYTECMEVNSDTRPGGFSKDTERGLTIWICLTLSPRWLKHPSLTSYYRGRKSKTDYPLWLHAHAHVCTHMHVYM